VFVLLRTSGFKAGESNINRNEEISMNMKTSLARATPVLAALFVGATTSPMASAVEFETASGWKTTLRGFVAARMDHDERDLGGSEPLFPPPEGSAQGENSALYFSANQSQIGFGLEAPKTDAFTNRAYIEFDFLNPNAGRTNTASPRLRHAFWEMGWDDGRQSLLVGQTNVLFGDRLPDLPYDNLNLALGSLFGREPQIRYTLVSPTKSGSRMVYAASINSPNSGLFNQLTGTAERTATPYVHAKIAFNTDALGGADYFGFEKGGPIPAEIALSGFVGRERVQRIAGTGTEEVVDASGIALSGVLPIIGIRNNQKAGSLSLQGQVWFGSNFDAYFGGNGQGIYETSTGVVGAVEGQGAFVSAKYYFTEALNINAIFGFEENNLDDLTGSGQAFRIASGLFAGNTFGAPGVAEAENVNIMFWYKPFTSQSLYTGAGWDYRDATYNDGTSGDNNRFTLAMFYNF
jgi:hypothetical protein